MTGLVSVYFVGVKGSLFTFVQSFYTSIYPWCLVTFCYYVSRYVRVHCLIKGSLEFCIHFVNCFRGHILGCKIVAPFEQVFF